MSSDHFVVRASDGRARAAVLHTASARVLTPAPVIRAPTGVPAHITADVVRRMVLEDEGAPRDAGAADAGSAGAAHALLLLHYGAFADHPPPRVLEAMRGADAPALHRYLHTEGLPLVVGELDDGGVPPFSSEKGLLLRTAGGNRSLAAKAYVQRAAELGIDIVLPPASEYTPVEGQNLAKQTRRAVERTAKWAKESAEAWAEAGSAGTRPARAQLWACVTGGADVSERRRCAQLVHEAGGDAVAGFVVTPVPHAAEEGALAEVIQVVASALPPAMPLMLAGGGGAGGLDSPDAILAAVQRGVDLVDCAYPFLLADMGMASVYNVAGGAASGPLKLNLRSERLAEDLSVILPGCTCPSCSQGHSRAYLYHLLSANEMLGQMLLTMHNLHHHLRFYAQIRTRLLAADDGFRTWADAFLKYWDAAR